jgi:hypothetical protein
MPKKRPRGGQKKPAPLRKDERLELRMSAAEKQGFAEAAQLAGLPLSGWIRLRLRSAAKAELESENRQVPFI